MVIATLMAPLAIAQTTIQTPVTSPQALAPNDAFVSGDGRFKLKFQTDGNLVLTKLNSTVLWAINKQIGAPPPLLFPVVTDFQPDGNLVVYWKNAVNTNKHPVWSSNTSGNPGATIDVQNDGNVVIKRANGQVIWQTNTCCH